MTTRPSLPELERLIAERDPDAAIQTALALLGAVDQRYGRLDGVELGEATSGLSPELSAVAFCNRFATALGRLLSKGCILSPAQFEQFLAHHRWIDIIFSLSRYRTSDHLLPGLLTARDAEAVRFEEADFALFLVVLSLNSRIDIELDQFWRANRVLATLAFLHYIASRYFFASRAFDFRERLLEWLPERLNEVELGRQTLMWLSGMYMNCSYAMTPRKHAIKARLIEQIRRVCLAAGCSELAAPFPAPSSERPTVVVVAEQFIPGHSVQRTHGRAVASLRERFHVVGVVHPNPTGTPMAEYFDECIPILAENFFDGIRSVANEILARKPALIFYIGVGMVSEVIALASLRLAPIQCASFGHTATTMSPAIDYMILPEDFVGSRECFSEKLLLLPKAAMPFAPQPLRKPPRPPADGVVRVAIIASTMKLNPHLFTALARIAADAAVRTEFHFFPIAAMGLAHFELARAVAERIPSAIVHPESAHDTYIERLSRCDLFLCPFPYGNMNGIIDAFRLGLPGVCRDGSEAHAHADVAIFARIGLPPELSTGTVDEYIAAAIKLIDDDEWRARCRDTIVRADLDEAFFSGDERLFCNAIADLIWPPPIAR